MSGVKHTPGRWTAHKTIEAHDGMPECWQIDAEHDAVCTTQFCYAPNTEANARLIAAAPDLLEACVEAAKTFRRYEVLHLDKGTVDGAQKAAANASQAKSLEATIARARGEQDGGGE